MSLSTALAAQDSRCFFPNDHQWTVEDKNEAKDALYNAIVEDGKAWDENFENERADFAINVENILRDSDDDKIGRIKDAYTVAVMDYASYAVESNPDAYCEVA